MSHPAGGAEDPADMARAVARGDAGRAPVVVVGLGPVGATVALLLARAGVPVVAVERDVELYPHPRAVALDDDALRVLQAAGVRDGDGLDLLPGGTVRIRGRGGRPLVELGPPPTTTGHPGLAFFRQPQLESTLRERLEDEPLVELRLGSTVVGVAAPGGAGRDATLRVAGPDGAVSELRAAWVLACDGGRSTIRTALRVRLRGRTSPSRWLVVDTDAPEEAGPPATAAGRGPAHPSSASDRTGVGSPFAPDAFEFGADPGGPWVHGPLPGGAHRWEFLLDAGTDRAQLEDPDVARALLARRVPGPVPTVRRAAVYAFHVRVAERWRVGRVLLLGDAAHLAPPFAGQGLCAGLRDAGNVAWKVAAAWHGTAHEELLDSYVAERRPHVLRTTALAAGLGVVVELRRPRAAAVRDAVLGRLGATRAVRGWIDRGGWRPPGTLRRGLLAGDRRHRHRAGEALPQPLVRGTDGVLGREPAVPSTGTGDLPPAVRARATADPAGHAPAVPLDDVLPTGWVLLGTDDPGPTGGRLGVPALPFAALGDDGVLGRWIAPAEVALVRPDRVVFGTATARGADALWAALAASSAVRSGP